MGRSSRKRRVARHRLHISDSPRRSLSTRQMTRSSVAPAFRPWQPYSNPRALKIFGVRIEPRKAGRPYSPYTPGVVPVGDQKIEPVKKQTTCSRRQQRKEILHALNKTGGSGSRRPTYTQDSKVRCKKR